MTKEQERIAEFIIQLHKDNNGVYGWDNYITEFSSSHNDRLIIARELKDRNFIANLIDSKTRLKKEGYEFKGFEKERQCLIDQKELSDKKDKYDILTKEFIYKKRYLPYIISAFALIVSIFGYYNKNEKQPSISKAEILIIIDSILNRK